MSLEDLDNNGTTEIIVPVGAAVYTLDGIGDGTFGPATSYAPGGDTLTIVDLNDDGNKDIVTAMSTIDRVFTLLGRGDGGFDDRDDFEIAIEGFPRSVEVGHFDADGVLDLVTANRNDSSISILRGIGDGTFAAPTYFDVPFPQHMALGDLNQDGNLDVIATSPSLDIITVLLGSGDGTFHSSQSFATANGPWIVSLVDVNNDDVLDAVSANGDGDGTVSVLIGTGTGEFENAISFPVGSFPRDLSLRDVNGDGNIDVIVPTESFVAGEWEVMFTVFLGRGDGVFDEAGEYSISDGRNGRVAIEDLNQDGISDVVITFLTTIFDPNVSGGGATVWFGQGDGTFTEAATYSTGGSPQTVEIIDINADGHLDLVILNNAFGQGVVSVLFGTGGGNLGARSEFAVGLRPEWLSIGDLDGDGDTDLVTPTRLLSSPGQGGIATKLNKTITS